MDGIADGRKRRKGRWSQKKSKKKQIRNSQLGRNVNKKKKIGTASSEETSINGKMTESMEKNDGTVNGMV